MSSKQVTLILSLLIVVTGGYTVKKMWYASPDASKNEVSTSIVQNELPLKTYSNNEFTFQYPEKIHLVETEGKIILNHSVPYENYIECDMNGDQEKIDFMEDFNVSIEVSDKPVIPLTDEMIESLKTAAQYYSYPYWMESRMDVYEIGELSGMMDYSYADGCGEETYYFRLLHNKALVVQWEAVQTMGYVRPGVTEEALKIPDVISREESEKIFTDILKSFRLKEGGAHATSD